MTSEIKQVELFRQGAHIPSDGKVRSFSKADLSDIAKDAPGGQIRIGHEDEDAEVGEYGDITKAYVKDGSLFADFVFKPLFAKALSELKNRSIGIIKQKGTWSFDHIAFLGDTPPAIPLKPIKFSKASSKAGTDTCLIFNYQSQPQEITMSDTDQAAFAAQKQQHTDAVVQFEKDKATFNAEKVQFEKDQGVLKEAQGTLATDQADFAKAQDGAFLDDLIGQNKLLAKDKDDKADFMVGLTEDQKVNYKAQLSAGAKVIDTGENSPEDGKKGVGKAPDGVDQASFEVDKKVRAYMKKHNVDYNEAYAATKEN